jgi:hypothetical protein
MIALRRVIRFRFEDEEIRNSNSLDQLSDPVC